MQRETWTEDEIKILKDELKTNKSRDEIALMLNRSKSSVEFKVYALGLCFHEEIKKNNPKYKAIYQDYDWFYQQYIVENKSYEEIAELCGATLRVIQKWGNERHHIDQHTFRTLKHINPLQREIIEIGQLGDGHIDRRKTQPMYIESHAEDEKDYLFWKYDILKDLCNKKPTYYKPSTTLFKGKPYNCQGTYRLNTRILDDLYEIREMKYSEIIEKISELQLCCLFLDDGSRDTLWSLCVAGWEQKDIELFLFILKDKFKLTGKQYADIRYMYLDAYSSKKLDELILKTLPNDMDIIKKKIINNKNIHPLRNDFYIITSLEKIGLARYCKTHHISYKRIKFLIEELDFRELKEEDFRQLLKSKGVLYE